MIQEKYQDVCVIALYNNMVLWITFCNIHQMIDDSCVCFFMLAVIFLYIHTLELIILNSIEIANLIQS